MVHAIFSSLRMGPLSVGPRLIAPFEQRG
jgi:hypothetical protein